MNIPAFLKDPAKQSIRRDGFMKFLIIMTSFPDQGMLFSSAQGSDVSPLPCLTLCSGSFTVNNSNIPSTMPGIPLI